MSLLFLGSAFVFANLPCVPSPDSSLRNTRWRGVLGNPLEYQFQPVPNLKRRDSNGVFCWPPLSDYAHAHRQSRYSTVWVRGTVASPLSFSVTGTVQAKLPALQMPSKPSWQ